MTRLISSANAAIENIRAYEDFIADNPDLINRLAKHRAWYAVRDGCGATLLVNLRDIEPRKEDDGFDGAFLSP